MNLNPEQQKAVNQISWPVLIMAWAWSWKTATVTARVENMIKNNNISPSNILAVTFTNKAAKEMKERIAKALWLEVERHYYKSSRLPLIWTFHSIWIMFLKEIINSNEYWEQATIATWIKKDFVIYDESDKLSLLKTIVRDELKFDEKQFPAKSFIYYISNAKNALITPKGYESRFWWYIN